MRNALGQGTVLGYCTNVHAGATLDQTQANLAQHALAVKQRISPDGPLGIGLWLSAHSARGLREDDRLRRFKDWLAQRGLQVFTINGFPYGDFHQRRVKHLVYKPDWTEPARVQYTRDLIHILSVLIPPGDEGSISTLPIGWQPWIATKAGHGAAADNLLRTVECMAELRDKSGTLIHLDLEPEPGCVLQRSSDVVEFFNRYLLAGGRRDLVLTHLRVCHDICHAAVMFEDQQEMLASYDRAGIRVGKVQVSAAVRADFNPASESMRRAMTQQLARFDEPRYLHQTVVKPAGSSEVRFFADLPAALADVEDEVDFAGELRVHFHVPIFLDRFGCLASTSDEIRKGLRLLRARSDVNHYEVETYAWDVLPDDLKMQRLADGIAAEMRWLIDLSEARL